MKKLLLCLAALLLAHFSDAQDASQYIPENAMVVAAVNATSYSSKMNMEEIWKLDFFKKLDEQNKQQLGDKYEQVSKLYKSPSEVGVNMFPQMYMYAEMADTLVVASMLMNMGDKAKFDAFVKEMNAQGNAVEQGKGFEFVMPNGSEAVALVWTKSTIALMMVTGGQDRIYQGLDYEDEAYYEKAEARRLVLLENQQQLLKSKMAGVAGVPKSLAVEPNFAKFKSGTYDVAVWAKVANIVDAIANMANQDPNMPPQIDPRSMMSSVNQATHYQAFMNFNNGHVEAQVRTFIKPELFQEYAKVYQKKIDPKFFTYLNGSKMLGMFSFAIDIKQTFALAIDSYKPVLAEMPQGKIAQSVLDLLGVALDEDALAGIFKGDMLVAVSDVKEMETTYYEYEYDENFNMNKVERVRKSPVPIFTGMVGIGNQENFMTILNAIANTGVLKQNGEVYEVALPQQQIPGLKFAVKDGIFFISNDDALLNGGLNKGIPKAMVANPALSAEILKNNSFMYLDMPKIFAKISSLMADMPPSQREMLATLQAKLGEIKASGFTMNAQEGYMENKLIIQMQDGNSNSAKQLFELIDLLNKQAAGDRN